MKSILYLILGMTVFLTGCANAAVPNNTYEPNIKIGKAALQQPSPEDVVIEFVEKYTSRTENTVIYFKMDNCRYCEEFSPIYDKVSKTFEGKSRFFTINVDEDDNAIYAQVLGIHGYPMILIFPKDGRGRGYPGAYQEQPFIKLLKENLK